MSVATRWKDDPSPTVAYMAERALLGALLLCPRMAILCGALRSEDFGSPFHSLAFAEMTRLGRFDSVTLFRALQPHRPPIDGWAAFVGSLLEADFALEDESVEAYTEIVREGATERRRAAWRPRSS